MIAGVDRAAAFLVPKHGSSAEECEDALCVLGADEAGLGDLGSDGPLVAAVADGASESLLARAWAHQVSAGAALAAYHDPELLTDRARYAAFAAGLTDAWRDYVDTYVADRSARGRPVRWYEEPGLAKGAFATLLAVRVEAPCLDDEPAPYDDSPDPAPRRWHAAALGDSCLFHVRDGRVVGAFPVDSADDFGTSPDLFGSRAADPELVAERTRFAAGAAWPEDRLVLATDAFSAWLLGAAPDEAAERLRLLDECARDADGERFAALVAAERSAGALRNDDVAVVVLSVAEAAWTPSR
ncbi:hypothetical protein [Yinghuangia seranimata]|uniref:hypothetical protein n=1 Tax=Yinghuangia seranimata TaxID=408067 RepID=UPI00248B1D0A|nr:hypothetical protein [Yinghuangia seranimata]MDI2132155.1 hypothetical protein [Yinghuangia seranimata]